MELVQQFGELGLLLLDVLSLFEKFESLGINFFADVTDIGPPLEDHLLALIDLLGEFLVVWDLIGHLVQI